MMFYFSVLCFCGVQAIFTTPSLDHEWEMYRTTFKKNYKSGEELLRRLIWEDNIRYIQQHNLAADRGEYTYWLGMNHMTDLSSREVEEKMHGSKPLNDSNSGSKFLTPANVVIPDEVDWRKEGYVTPVKDQGMCGSCWAFSTTGSIEGQNFKKTGKLVSLSEQNLVDCSTKYGNYGCAGGWVEKAYLYVEENGIDTEESYPYEENNGTCRFKPSGKGATVTGYIKIEEGDENALKVAVATVGPISVGINADGPSFQSYKTGIYDNPLCNSARVDHAVLVVGYGVYNGEDYWLVKNSWGTHWGMNGYIMMSRNKGNQCWIASQALYPLV